MPTKNPRVNVTFNPNDAEILQLICSRKKISMSGLVRKVVEDWLEEYEDILLAKRTEEAERQWMEEGMKTVSHEELCQELGIESNMQKKPETTLKNSLKTSKKESSGRLKRGLQSRPRNRVKH